MALHRPPCESISDHILLERADSEALDLPISVFLPLALAEYDREHAVPVIDPVDAWKRLRDLGWTEPELRAMAGDR